MNSEQNRETIQLAELKTKIGEHEDISLYKDILDDELLLGFLRGKKFKVQAAFDCLLLSIQLRTKKYREFTQSYLPSTLSNLSDFNKAKILRNRVKGYNVLFYDIKSWDPSKQSFQEIFAEVVLKFDEVTRSYGKHSPNNDAIAIADVGGTSFAHAKQITPRVVIQLLDYLQNSYPGRPIAFHFLNEGYIMRTVFNLIKPLVKEKLRNRFHFHSSNLSSLHEHVPKSILPMSLGGELTEEDAYDHTIIDKVCSHEEFYKELGRR